MPSNSSTVDPHEAMSPDACLYIDEITHRTLNEYTTILALVRRAAAVVLDETSGQALEDIAIRLRASAASLRVLRPPRDGHVRALDQELETLCSALTSSVLSPKHITLTLSSDPVALSAYRCWKILLIVSELVTNSARHAFQHAETGSVTVCVRVQGDIVRCAIIDNGTFPRDAAPGRGTGIVNELIGDLGGFITRNVSDAGTAVSFAVPMAEAFFGQALRVPKQSASHCDQSNFYFIRIKDVNGDAA